MSTNNSDDLDAETRVAMERSSLSTREILSAEKNALLQLNSFDLEITHLNEDFRYARDEYDLKEDELLDQAGVSPTDFNELDNYDDFMQERYLHEDGSWNIDQIIQDITDEDKGGEGWSYGDRIQENIDIVNDLHESVRGYIRDQGEEPPTPEPGTDVDIDIDAQLNRIETTVNDNNEVIRDVYETVLNIYDEVDGIEDYLEERFSSLEEEILENRDEIRQNRTEMHDRFDDLESQLEDYEPEDTGTDPDTEPDPEPTLTPDTDPDPTPTVTPDPEPDYPEEDDYDKPSDTLEWLGGLAYGDYGLSDFTLGLRGKKRGP